jgi:hypothetical protein
MSIKPSTWSRIGDFTHVALIINASIFAYAVVVHNDSGIFDPVWQPEGFCVANRETPFWNSHDLCLYFDTVFALVHGLLYLALRNYPGMDPANELVKFNILGVAGHGFGHGAIAKAMREGVESSGLDQTGLDTIFSKSPIEIVVKMIPFLIFWIFLLKATMPSAKMNVILPMTAASIAGNVLVPQQFGFTYVQTVLLLAFSVNQLLRPSNEKEFAYALFPMIAGFPVSVIAWIESTMCSKGVLDIGGHLIYDAYIPLASMAFYMIYWAVSGSAKPKSL